MSARPVSDDPFSMDGKVAVVTGASGTLGRRYCRLLASRGATVVAAARRLDRLEALADETAGVVPVGCDVTDDSQLQRLVDVAAEHGGPDIVVNNAGTSDAVVRAHEQDPAQFRRVLDINLTAAFVLSSAAAREMIGRGRGGSIVNVASMLGVVASGGNHQAGYVASKTGMIGLTRELAKQVGARRHPGERHRSRLLPQRADRGDVRRRRRPRTAPHPAATP